MSGPPQEPPLRDEAERQQYEPLYQEAESPLLSHEGRMYAVHTLLRLASKKRIVNVRIASLQMPDVGNFLFGRIQRADYSIPILVLERPDRGLRIVLDGIHRAWHARLDNRTMIISRALTEAELALALVPE